MALLVHHFNSHRPLEALVLCRWCCRQFSDTKSQILLCNAARADTQIQRKQQMLLSLQPHTQNALSSITIASKVPVYSTRWMSQSAESKTKSFHINWWQRLLIVGGFVGGGLFLYNNAEHEKTVAKEKIRYQEFQKAKLGGDWQLTDHDDKKRSSTDFRGQWQLLYFGFTHCPDICPEELEKLTKLVKMIDEDKGLPNMQPVFITLDPERDTPALIKDYLKGFNNPRIVGFTGSLEEIRTVAKQFRAYFGKGPRDEDNDYIVDHTIIIYLINPDGQFVNYFDRSNSAEKIKKTVSQHVYLYNELQKRKA